MSKIHNISEMANKDFRIFVHDGTGDNTITPTSSLPATSIIIDVVKKDDNNNATVLDMKITDANGSYSSLLPFLEVKNTYFNVDTTRTLQLNDMSKCFPNEYAIINAMKKDFYSYDGSKYVDLSLDDSGNQNTQYAYVYFGKKIVFTGADNSDGIRSYLLDKNNNRLYCDGESYTGPQQQHRKPLTGDINGDGVVDVSDLNIISNIVLGTDSADKYDNRADIDGNGVVDISDMNAVVNVLLGKDPIPNKMYAEQLPSPLIPTNTPDWLIQQGTDELIDLAIAIDMYNGFIDKNEYPDLLPEHEPEAFADVLQGTINNKFTAIVERAAEKNDMITEKNYTELEAMKLTNDILYRPFNTSGALAHTYKNLKQSQLYTNAEISELIAKFELTDIIGTPEIPSTPNP